MPRYRLLLFPLLLLAMSCSDMRESLREKYTGERKGNPVVGMRRAPILNPGMKAAAPVMPVQAAEMPAPNKAMPVAAKVAPAIPAGAKDADPYDMYDEKGNAKEPVSKAKESPTSAKEEPQKSFWARLFGDSEEPKAEQKAQPQPEPIVANAHPERKSFRGSAGATAVAKATPAKVLPEPVAAENKPAPEEKPSTVSPAPSVAEAPIVPQITAEPQPAAEEPAPALTVESEEKTPVAENLPGQADQGNGVIIPKLPKQGTASAPAAPKTKYKSDSMVELAPAVKNPAAPVAITTPPITIEAEEHKQAPAQQVAQVEPVAEAAPKPQKPELADVPEKPKAFETIKKTKEATKEDLVETHEKAMDEKKDLAKEPTDLPAVEDTIEEIRGALESPYPIVVAAATVK